MGFEKFGDKTTKKKKEEWQTRTGHTASLEWLISLRFPSYSFSISLFFSRLLSFFISSLLSSMTLAIPSHWLSKEAHALADLLQRVPKRRDPGWWGARQHRWRQGLCIGRRALRDPLSLIWPTTTFPWRISSMNHLSRRQKVRSYGCWEAVY